MENQQFNIATEDLVKLVETPKEEAKDRLEQLGGVKGIAKALHVTLKNGLDSANAIDLKQREVIYGRNFIEPEKPCSIFQLMWQAFQV